MTLDTGAGVSIISEETWHATGKPKLEKTSICLKDCQFNPLNVKGTCKVSMIVRNQKAEIELVVVGKPFRANLFGRNLMEVYSLDYAKIANEFYGPKIAMNAHLVQIVTMTDVLSEFPDLFTPGLGCIKFAKAHIELRPGAEPKFYKPRPVPFAMVEKVEKDLKRLQDLDVIEPIMQSDWAAPLVCAPKPNGGIRLCGDFKLTVNQAIEHNWYPIPTTVNLFASLVNAKVFTKVDMSDAYFQILLDEAAKQMCVINTHKGLFRYKRLPFGVSFAVGLFQQVIEQCIAGLDGVRAYLDDIICVGKDQKEHDERLRKLLTRLQEVGVKLKREKCFVSQSSLKYLGHIIDATGIHPDPEKVKAINEAPEPQNKEQLQSFIGLVNYYGSYINDLATRMKPLYALIRKDATWEWTKECKVAFKDLCSSISSDKVLVHYDPKLRVGLDCDASSYGLGVVLFHYMPDGTQRPIAFAAKSLSDTERNYSQVEREALSIVFGVKKFHQYIYGRKFDLVTDHKPLLVILGPKGHLQSVSASRLHRWAWILSGYDYEIRFRRTKEHANCDYFSRSPLKIINDPCLPYDDSKATMISYFEEEAELPVNFEQIRKATLSDNVLNRGHSRCTIRLA